METMTTDQFWMLAAMAANPIIFIVLMAAIFWLLINLLKSEKECRGLNREYGELTETVDKLCTQMEESENLLTETRKKLIDALQQKTRANDYAKSVEIKNASMLEHIDKLKVLCNKKTYRIGELNDINSDQSKGLKKWMLGYAILHKAYKELDL